MNGVGIVGAPYSSATQTNPRGPATGSPASGSARILRGGGWAGYEDNCRTAFRTVTPLGRGSLRRIPYRPAASQ